jgi:3-hydroxyisobutyrate dehydrogenase
VGLELRRYHSFAPTTTADSGASADSVPRVRIAVLGTGIMGAPIARRLAEAGNDVRAWNRTPAKAEGLGAAVASTPAEAVEDAELVLTMLADGPAVDQVVRQAAPSIAAGTVWAQASTVGIEWTRRLAELASEHDLAYVDAPVLGTRAPAEQGQLVVLLAGPESARPLCEAALPAIARKLVWVGEEIGAASALKLVLNHWTLNTIENIAETLALAEGLGVDPRRFLESIAGGNMDMPYAHLKTEALLSGDLEPTFTLRLAEKDVGLIVEAAAASGVDLGLAPATRARMAHAIELGHGAEDMAATYYATRLR